MSKGLLGLGFILAISVWGGAVAVGLPPSVCGAYAPVHAAFQFQPSISGATSVYSYSPNNPDGLIVALHGAGGSAVRLAENTVEWRQFFNDAVARNYAILVPESDDRYTKKWSIGTTARTNKDAVRIGALINKMGLNRAPIYMVGMSQGGGAAPVIAALLKSQAYQLRALALYCSGETAALRDKRYNIPVVFNLMSADTMTSVASVQSNVDNLKKRKIDAELFVKPVERVCPLRFARIEEISNSDSNEIYVDLVTDGALTSSGGVMLQLSDKDTTNLNLPGIYLRYQREIAEQMGAASAQHLFFSDRDQATLDFFDLH